MHRSYVRHCHWRTLREGHNTPLDATFATSYELIIISKIKVKNIIKRTHGQEEPKETQRLRKHGE